MLLGYDVRKAIDPLTPEGFLMISELVADKIAGAAGLAEGEVVQEIFDALDFDWEGMSEQAIVVAIKAVETAIASSYESLVIPTITDVLQVEGPTVMSATRLGVIARERIQISADLSQRDLEAELLIRRMQTNYIRESSGARAVALSEKAREVVATGLSQGLGTEEISRGLKEFLSADIPRPDSYWRVVADAFVGTARTASQIAAYEDAEIQTYEIVAVLDEVTTDICRFMDGKVFRVSAARGLLNSLDGLGDPEQVRFANPWVRRRTGEDGNLELYVPNSDGSSTTIAQVTRSGIGSRDDRGEYANALGDADLVSLGIPVPPFHGRCRTTIVAGAE